MCKVVTGCRWFNWEKDTGNCWLMEFKELQGWCKKRTPAETRAGTPPAGLSDVRKPESLRSLAMRLNHLPHAMGAAFKRRQFEDGLAFTEREARFWNSAVMDDRGAACAEAFRRAGWLRDSDASPKPAGSSRTRSACLRTTLFLAPLSPTRLSDDEPST